MRETWHSVRWLFVGAARPMRAHGDDVDEIIIHRLLVTAQLS